MLLASLIEEDLKNSDTTQIASHLHMLKSRATRMDRLLERLLEFSTIGTVEERPKPFNTKTSIETAMHLLKPSELSLNFKLDGEFPTLNSFKESFESVIRNLVDNAIKHRGTTADLKISVSTKNIGERWTFYIEDNGPEIAQENHEKVFEVFKALRPKDEVEGCGLGLAIVRRLLDNVGGSIKIDESFSKGTRFIIHWPPSSP